MSDKKENKFFSEVKNQVIAGISLVIAAGFGLIVTNMEAWFSPEKPEDIVLTEQAPINPAPIIINMPKDTVVKVIEKEVKPKKEEDITW